MNTDFSALDLRILGVLMEKEATTPDAYPLSLNALVQGCNQKSNRDPVLALGEAEVRESLESLQERRLVRRESGYGSRVLKYRHRFCNTEFSELQLPPGGQALLTLLFLRGPQTPGELRSRSQRLHPFAHVTEVESLLDTLAEHQPDPLVVRLPRAPGKREHRYAHCLGAASGAHQDMPEAGIETDNSAEGAETRPRLEARIARLEAELAQCRARLEALDG